MEEGEVPDIVGSSVVNSPSFKTFQWLPDFTWVNFDRVNAEEKFTAEPELEDTELVVNDIIQHADFEAGVSPVIPHQTFVISRFEMFNVNSENSPALFKHGNGENKIFKDVHKAGSDDNNGFNDKSQSGDFNNGDDFDKRTVVQDIKDVGDDSCSTSSEILISVTDLRHCARFEAANAKELLFSNNSLLKSQHSEDINTKPTELSDCTGSTQDEGLSDWAMAVSNKEADNRYVAKIRAGLFAISSNCEERFAVPVDCETDVEPIAVVSSANRFEAPVAMLKDDAGLTVVLNDTVAVAMADDAAMSAEPIIVSDDEDSVEVATIMANDNGTVEKQVVIDAVLDDGEYAQGLCLMGTAAEQPAIVITWSDDDGDDELASKLTDAECDVELSQEAAATGPKLTGKVCQHVSDLSCISLRKTAENNKLGAGQCGLQNGIGASQVAEMDVESSSSLQDLETPQTEISINQDHRKEIVKILKAERLLFTVQQSLENDFQGCDSVFEVLNDVQKLLHELHASQSLETRSIARKMEHLGKYRENQSLLLYKGKLLKIRRRKLIGLSENHQHLYEKALSSSGQLENRIVCDYSFPTARKPQELSNAILGNETIVEKSFPLKEANHNKSLNEVSSSRKSVRFTLPDSVGSASRERDNCQQSQKTPHGSRLIHHNEKDHPLVPVECLTQTPRVQIYDSVAEPQIQVVNSWTNSNMKATGNNNLKRSNGLVPVVTASKVSKASESESYATQANAHSSRFVNEFSENISSQTSKISPDCINTASLFSAKKDVLAPLDKFSLDSTGDVNSVVAERVLNAMPSSNCTIYEANCCRTTSAVTLISDSNDNCLRKSSLVGYKLPTSITTASMKTSTAKFASEPSGISSRKLDVLEQKLPASLTTASYMYPLTSAPCLLSTHTVSAPSELHSAITSSVFSCPSSQAVKWNYQQGTSRAISQSMGVQNIKQSSCRPLLATSVINSNIKQKLQQMPTLAEKVLQNSQSGGQTLNPKDLHKTGCTSEEIFIPPRCQSISQRWNITSKISLRHLFNEKLIQPGVNVLSTRCKNGQAFASVTPGGHIKTDRGQIFKSIRAWYLDAIGLDSASQATINRQVMYYGVPIITIVSGAKDLEHSSQDSPVDDYLLTNRSQTPAEQDEDLLPKTMSTITFLHLHSEAELEPCDKWAWSTDFTFCSPSWLETIDDWK